MLNLLYLIIAAVLGSFGQVFLKKGAVSTQLTTNYFTYFLDLLKNPFAWLGTISYFASLGFYMVALNKTELSIARSISALSYVFVIAISFFLFKDSISPLKIIAIILISIGIFILGFEIK